MVTEALAQVRNAVELALQGELTRAEALARVPPQLVERCFDSHLLPRDRDAALAAGKVLGAGLPVSAGAACGVMVTDAEEAARRIALGQPVVFVCSSLSMEHAHRVEGLAGLVALDDGIHSLAARLARRWAVPCVGRCTGLRVEPGAGLSTDDGRSISPGSPVTIDGATGDIIASPLPVRRLGAPTPSLHCLLAWSDQGAAARVWMVASSPRAIAAGRAVGAEGAVIDPLAAMLATHDSTEALAQAVIRALMEEAPPPIDALPALREATTAILEPLLAEMQGFPTVLMVSPLPLECLAQALRAHQLPHLAAQLPVALAALPFSRLLLSRPPWLRLMLDAVIDVAAELETQGQVIDLAVAVPGLRSAAEARTIRKLLDDACARAMQNHDIPATCRLAAWLDLPASLALGAELAQEVDLALLDWSSLAPRSLGYDPALDAVVGACDSEAPLPTGCLGLLRMLETAVRHWRDARPGAPLGLVGGQMAALQAAHLTHTLGLDCVACAPASLPIIRRAVARAPH